MSWTVLQPIQLFLCLYGRSAYALTVGDKDDNTENFVVRDKFNFKKMTDKYEEKNYELNIKRNLANSISQKLILRLAVN
mgnify:CR=1 FL=1